MLLDQLIRTEQVGPNSTVQIEELQSNFTSYHLVHLPQGLVWQRHNRETLFKKTKQITSCVCVHLVGQWEDTYRLVAWADLT